MDVQYQRCAGLDVQKRTVVACVRLTTAQGAVEQEVRTFGTMTADLLALGEWLAGYAVNQVAMESTGVYTLPTMLSIVGSPLKRVSRSAGTEPKHDTYRVLIDLDAFDHGPNDLAACLPIGVLQAQLHLGRKLLEPSDKHPELAFDLGLVLEALRFCFHLVEAFPKAQHPRLKFGFFHEPLGIAVDQARNPATQLAQLHLDLLAFLGRRN